MMPKSSFRFFLAVALAATGACGKDSPPGPPPPPLALLAGDGQAAPANTNVPQAIQLAVRDSKGAPLAGQVVNFVVALGGGSLSASQATSDNSGIVTAPTWRLGKSAVAQMMRATFQNEVLDIIAIVATQYDIVVRFWGPTMTPEQQALFANAAARIRGSVTGEIVDALAVNTDLNSSCGITGQPILNETIDDVVIYASIQAIDGPGNVLASAGPCLSRGPSNLQMTAVGIMQFDSADLASLAGSGSFQDVITHEMLHVLGLGTLWTRHGLITGAGTSDPRFTGNLARQACVPAGAVVSCANSVPVEGTGGSGTADAHWRESTFGSELMTGFYNSGVNPLSAISIASLQDLSYGVNMADVDAYTVPILLRANNAMVTSQPAGWEQLLTLRGILLPDGRVQRVTPK